MVAPLHAALVHERRAYGSAADIESADFSGGALGLGPDQGGLRAGAGAVGGQKRGRSPPAINSDSDRRGRVKWQPLWTAVVEDDNALFLPELLLTLVHFNSPKAFSLGSGPFRGVPLR